MEKTLNVFSEKMKEFDAKNAESELSTTSSLILQKQKMDRLIAETLCHDMEQLSVMADSMAEAATNLTGHGFQVFMTERQQFLAKVKSMRDDYMFLLNK